MMEYDLESQSQSRVAAVDHADPTSTLMSDSHHRHVILKFEDVVYKVKTKEKILQGDHPKSRLVEKTILKGVSGVVLPGEILAMMGPSGSGKTTLLTALGARLKVTSGSITYNNRPFTAAMNRSMGFVTQDDVLYPHLTVTETLLYTALLRLPRTLSRQEKAAQAEAVVQQLGLGSCRNCIVGGPMIRGVSGGERKRVSIGQEMLINPSLIFLDEPTSGLDSTTAQRIVSVLRDMAGRGRTVVLTIHQPSSRIFYMFHKVLLMSDGSPVYYGKGSEVMDYFAGLGHVPPVPMNPSDFILDLANGVASDEVSESREKVKQSLVVAYEEKLQRRVKAEVQESKGRESARGEEELGRWSSSWWLQFRVLVERDLKERRHTAFSPVKIAQVLILSVISGLVWLHSTGHVVDQVGLLFFIIGFWAFTPLYDAIFTFPMERDMLHKERTSGMYKLSSYYAARTVIDLPMELILPTVFTTVVYWMGGLKPSAIPFFETVAVMLLEVLVSQGLGLAIGAVLMDLKTATMFASMLMLAFMLAGGFFVQRVPAFVGWIKYASMFYYTFKLTVAAQFSPGDEYECGRGAAALCWVRDVPSVKAVGMGSAGLALGALLAMLVVYRAIAYVALMRVGSTR